MTNSIAATPLSTPTASVDEDSHVKGSLSPISFHRAIELARQMRLDLSAHTKDRKWRLKSYPSCFKASHAITWALENINANEAIAVVRLNQMIDFGLLTHVVDPSKKFRVGETKTLYFRTVDAILDSDEDQCSDFSTCPGKAIPLLSGMFGSSLVATKGDNIGAIQQQLANIEHVLQETVNDMNYTRGKCEMLNQEVRGLVSQQKSTFVMMLLMNMYFLIFVVPSSGLSLLCALALGITMISTAQCGWRCISLWSDIDSRGLPMEAISIMDEKNSLTEESSRTAKPLERKLTKSSIGSMISKSIKSMKEFPGMSTKTYSMRKETPKVFMRDAYSLPEVSTWKHRPLMVCVNSTASPSLKVPRHEVGACPLGVPFKFSSELFEGKCLVRLKGSKSDNPDVDSEYFDGRKRIFQSVVQGRFKQMTPVWDVVTGHEFVRPLKNLPHPFVLKTATSFISKICPGANIAVHIDQPFVEATLGGTSQVVRGDAPGNEPNIACLNMVEDCSVFGGAFATDVSVSRRKRIFSNPAKCKEYTFDTETVRHSRAAASSLITVRNRI
ncbi:hypothetical protein ACHAWF_009559 [Thalassiosira exigua]